MARDLDHGYKVGVAWRQEGTQRRYNCSRVPLTPVDPVL